MVICKLDPDRRTQTLMEFLLAVMFRTTLTDRRLLPPVLVAWRQLIVNVGLRRNIKRKD
jgi:hypothetical protein